MDLGNVKEWFSVHKKQVVTGASVGVGVALLAGVGISLLARHNAVSKADAQMQKAADMLEQVLLPETEGEEGNQTVNLEDIDEKYKLGLELHESDPYMRKRIDFTKLSELVESGDIHSWLTMPDTPIDYVVMQGTDEDPVKYLWQDMYGEKSRTGCLFVQGALPEEDDHEVIYGHRLKDHSLLFGPLMQFREESYAKEHTVVYTYDTSQVTKWELAYAVNGKGDDPVYYFPYEKGTQEWTDLTDNLAEKAHYAGEPVGAEDDMLVLSTCSGRSAGRPERLYLVYRDVAYYLY